MKIVKAYIPLSKVDEEQRMVYGYASTDALDSQGEVITRAAIVDALPDYMRFANIREMHTMSAVGVCKMAEPDDKGLWIGAKVVDDAAWVKVKEGVYKGFSVGGRSLAKMDGQITKMRLTEISLVDRPANPECVIDTWKADALEGDDADDDGAEQAGKAAQPEDATKGEQPPQQSEAVAKGTWNAQRLIEALAMVNAACESATYEAKQGEHSADLIAAMKVSLAALGDVAQRYLGEEIANMLAGQPVSGVKQAGEGEGDLAKRGARYSKATKEALAKVHGMLRECDKAMADMGYDKADEEEPAAKADGATAPDAAAVEVVELAKAAGIDATEGALYSDLFKGALVELKKSRDRIAELEAQPAPMRGARTQVVGKGDDVNGDDTVAPAGQIDTKDPNAMFKAALSRPVAFGPQPGI